MSEIGAGRICFDLRTQPCINILTTSGQPNTVSLEQVFDRANDISAITGSTPGEVVAVIEYLLALIYASGQAPDSQRSWQQAVESESSTSLEAVAQWLRRRRAEDWDLFHPERPHGQNALLAPHLDEHGVGFGQLVPERAGDYNIFFDQIHLHFPEPLPAAAAFRSMLTQHVYGLQGRARVKASLLGSQLTYLATGRLTSRVRVLARGRTLGDLLRLNVAPTLVDGTFNRTWTDGRTRRDFRSAKNPHTPDGPADLHSFLGRSVLLRPVRTGDGIGVDKVLVGAGELLEPDLPGEYRQDEVLVERNKELVPLAPSPDTAMWRQATALYAATVDRTKGGDLYHRIASLTEVSERPIDLWAVGVVANRTVALTWVDDQFPFTPGRKVDLRRAADEGAAICDYAAKCLFAAANRIREAAYPQEKPSDKAAHTARFNGARDFWAEAGTPFHRLLDHVSTGGDVESGLREFGQRAHALTRRALGLRLATLPDDARGHRARAQAGESLRNMSRSSKAPYFYRIAEG